MPLTQLPLQILLCSPHSSYFSQSSSGWVRCSRLSEWLNSIRQDKTIRLVRWEVSFDNETWLQGDSTVWGKQAPRLGWNPESFHLFQSTLHVMQAVDGQRPGRVSSRKKSQLLAQVGRSSLGTVPDASWRCEELPP